MGWVDEELAGAELGDVRLDLRLMRIVETLARHAEQSVPQMCGNWAETKAAYGFWGNDRVDWREILAPHQRRTVQRAMAQPVVLVIQDSTGVDLRLIRRRQAWDTCLPPRHEDWWLIRLWRLPNRACRWA
jgi:hypothetical protein